MGPGFEIAYGQHFEERIGADQLFASGPTRHVRGGHKGGGRCHRSEPEAARIAGRTPTARSGFLHRVALELSKERQGQRVQSCGS